MEAKSKHSGDATEAESKSPVTQSMAERMLQSQSASSEDTEAESSPRLNRAQIRGLVRQLPRKHRVKFFGLHRFSSRLLPRPSNLVRFRAQLGAAVEED